MSLPTRACLAMGLCLAGGFGLPGPPGYAWLGLALALALALVATGAAAIQLGPPTRLARAVSLLALALLLGLLARALGRVVIATPAALWTLPIGALALVWKPGSPGGKPRSAIVWVLSLVTATAAAGAWGAEFEARGLQPRGRVDGSPVLGVHPRQATAVTIDGFGPHDLVVDDFVDPPGGQGYDPDAFATRLEAELRAIAERHYADGPARARAAFGSAEVEIHEAVVPPADRALYSSMIGLEIRSGTRGEGSTVEFGCPGQPLDPRGATASPPRTCPRKYLVDGSTGLGLAPRFPGYTRVVGRDRARLARGFGWPTGDARVDRRSLALESGAWLLGVVLLGWALARRRARDPSATATTVALAGCVGLVLAAGLLLAVLGPPQPAVDATGPVVPAILLLLIPNDRRERTTALPWVALIVALAVSPLAGHGDAVELVATARDTLADLGLTWATAGALAGSFATIALTLAVGICAQALVDCSWPPAVSSLTSRRRPAAMDGLTLLLALGIGLGLALRKPADDPALLAGGAALLVLGLARTPTRAGQRTLGLVFASVAAAPWLAGEVISPISAALLTVAALLCLLVGLAPPSPASPPSPPSNESS